MANRVRYKCDVCGCIRKAAPYQYPKCKNKCGIMEAEDPAQREMNRDRFVENVVRELRR